jgi:hypothetical protein
VPAKNPCSEVPDSTARTKPLSIEIAPWLPFPRAPVGRKRDLDNRDMHSGVEGVIPGIRHAIPREEPLS